MKKLIAVIVLGLGSAQAGVALADNNDVFADPFWKSSKFMVSETTRAQGGVQLSAKYDQVDRYNP